MTRDAGADDGRDGVDVEPDGPKCPFCDNRLFSRHCKYVCPQHGVVIDCSDPFL